jgi:hypothetical protein
MPTKRPAEQILTSERAVAEKTVVTPVYTGETGRMTSLSVLPTQ